MSRVTRRHLIPALAAMIVVVLCAGTAFAFWSATSAGNGNASADSLAAPIQQAPTNVTSSSAQINWTAVTTGWQKDAVYTATVSGGGGQTCNAAASVGNCSLGSLVSGTTYTVTLTATFSSWTSAASNPQTVTPTASDTTAPTVSMTFPAAPGPTTYKASRWTDASSCQVTPFNATPFSLTAGGICGTATDATAVQSVKVSIKRGSDNTYWNGTTFTGTTESFNTATLGSGTSTRSWALAFARPTDGTYTVHVQTADTVGNAQSGTTYAATSAFTVDTVAPTVTINQAAGQTDPTKSAPINFTVTFSESVTGFGSGGVALSGTAGATTATVTGSGTTYNVAVTGMTAAGTVVASVTAGGATDAAGNGNVASTSTDNSVTLQAPTATSISTTDHGGTPGKIEATDSFAVTFDAAMAANTMCTGLSAGGSVSGVTVTLSDDTGTGNKDQLLFSGANCTHLGIVELGGQYVSGGNLAFGSSTVQLSSDGKTLTITIGGTPTGTGTAATVAKSVVTYRPDTGAKSAAGVAIDGNIQPVTANTQAF
ncbi:MAG: large repetitive protein [Frankiaceae bacterium]|jgi:hypothetical protein|nr:large repetitive protein [Frankiaceae bacterium]